jgi:hypothetical protein
MYIGRIVQSNAHTDYVCQIYGPGEVEAVPAPGDHAFGTFVRVALGESYGALVGIIYDTVLLNPEFGNLGPRLSPAADLAVFSPDYLAEKVMLVGIMAVGWVAPGGAVHQGVPPLAAQADAQVELMEDAAVHAFHWIPGGSVHMAYAPLVLGQGSHLARHLLLSVVDRLDALFEGHAAPLTVLRNELLWQATIGPVGGRQ